MRWRGTPSFSAQWTCAKQGGLAIMASAMKGWVEMRMSLSKEVEVEEAVELDRFFLRGMLSFGSTQARQKP